ncbi:MAG TPA: DegT/DnrJ/EryC1/StrS family aminotransferase [archaeon]|nr:DegT/DnrJ/EryC1/StrS family aminotransferase [archaeon]
MEKLKVPRVDLRPQEAPLKQEIMDSISKIIDSGHLIMGEHVNLLEKKIASYITTPDAVGVANGTDAIKLCLAALDIGKGDEVITVPFTFAANVEATAHVGAKAVFADVDKETFNIIPEQIEGKITKKTKAILPVHLFGCPAPMKEIMEIAKEHGLFVIEDCAQAFGAELNGKKCGSFGQLNATSFYPTKNLGCYGDGGMVFVNDTRYSEKLRKIRFHGQSGKYMYEYLGWNSRLDEIQAAVILPKLGYIDAWNNERIKAAQKYASLLKGIEQVQVPIAPKGAKHIYHLYTIKAQKRDELAKFLSDNGVETAINYPLAIHEQKAYMGLGYKKGDFPNSELLCAQSLSLPMFVGINGDQIEYVCSKIAQFYKK